MLKNIIGLLAGLLFGLGLLVSGMTDPVKVQGFLDVFGAWDISLALVMGGGLIVAFFGVRLAKRQQSSWIGTPIDMPSKTVINKKITYRCDVVRYRLGASWYLPRTWNCIARYWSMASLCVYSCHDYRNAGLSMA